MNKLKKFNTGEVVIGTLTTLAIDGVCALLDLTTLGYFIATPLQSVTSAGTSWWLYSKGGKRAWKLERQIIKQLSNFLPVVPTTATAFIIETVKHNIESKNEER